jgi:hypothetical protein
LPQCDADLSLELRDLHHVAERRPFGVALALQRLEPDAIGGKRQARFGERATQLPPGDRHLLDTGLIARHLKRRVLAFGADVDGQRARSLHGEALLRLAGRRRDWRRALPRDRQLLARRPGQTSRLGAGGGHER